MSFATERVNMTIPEWEQQITMAFNRGIDTAVKMIRQSAARPDKTPEARDQLLLLASDIQAILAMAEASR